MRSLVSFILIVWSTALSAQNLGASPVKEIIDNPNRPDLAQLIFKTSEMQLEQKGSFNLEQIKQRNLYDIIMLPSGQLLVRSEPANVEGLNKDILRFLKNPNGDIDLSDSIDGTTPLTGPLFLSEGLVLVNYLPTDMGQTVAVVQSAAIALSKYRDYLSLRGFKVPYVALPPLGKSVIDQYFNAKLILAPDQLGDSPIPPPPPVPSDIPEDEEEEIEIEPGGSGVPNTPPAPESPFPGIPTDMEGLEEAAEKLKDIVFGGGSDQASDQPAVLNNEVYDLQVVDKPPVLAACQSAPNGEEGKYCFSRTLERLGENNFVYPENLKGSGTYGSVFIELSFDAQGKLRNRRIARGLESSIDAAVLAAYRDLEVLAPATIHGKAVAMNCIVKLAIQE